MESSLDSVEKDFLFIYIKLKQNLKSKPLFPLATEV